MLNYPFREGIFLFIQPKHRLAQLEAASSFLTGGIYPALGQDRTDRTGRVSPGHLCLSQENNIRCVGCSTDTPGDPYEYSKHDLSSLDQFTLSKQGSRAGCTPRASWKTGAAAHPPMAPVPSPPGHHQLIQRLG